MHRTLGSILVVSAAVSAGWSSVGAERLVPVHRLADERAAAVRLEDVPTATEIAFTVRRAELRTVATASATGEHGPALERAVRELLALQASDWAFQMTHELAADYPMERVSSHSRELDAALAALTDSGAVSQAAVRNLAPDVELAPLFAT